MRPTAIIVMLVLSGIVASVGAQQAPFKRTVLQDGQPLAAGSRRGDHAIHNATNKGSGAARILATYVVEQGKPLATPVTGK